MGDVVLLTLVGVKIVLVHAAAPTHAMLKRLGKESSFVDGLRVTDRRLWTWRKWCWPAS
jgi:acetylglutamate kinase